MWAKVIILMLVYTTPGTGIQFDYEYTVKWKEMTICIMLKFNTLKGIESGEHFQTYLDDIKFLFGQKNEIISSCGCVIISKILIIWNQTWVPCRNHQWRLKCLFCILVCGNEFLSQWFSTDRRLPYRLRMVFVFTWLNSGFLLWNAMQL